MLRVHLQDPKEADPLMKVQNEIDETKIVLVRMYVHINVCLCVWIYIRTLYIRT